MDKLSEESDCSSMENFLWNEENILSSITANGTRVTNELNYDVRSEGVQADFDNFEESKHFTSAFERLELCGKNTTKISTIPIRRTIDAQTDVLSRLEDRDAIVGFRTREISTFRLVIQGPEILNYQGTRQAPEDIAQYWKKDSRMWLWKSVRLARRNKNRLKAPTV